MLFTVCRALVNVSWAQFLNAVISLCARLQFLNYIVTAALC